MIEVLGDAPDRRVELLLRARRRCTSTLSRYGPGRAGADLHVHHEHTDIFYVLEGELTVMLADEEVVVGPGELVHVPPHVVHGFRNASDADVQLPQLPRPGRRVRRLHARAARRRQGAVRPAPAAGLIESLAANVSQRRGSPVR